MTTQRPVIRGFREPYKLLTLEPGENGLIFEEKLADWEVGFWKRFSNAFFTLAFFISGL